MSACCSSSSGSLPWSGVQRQADAGLHVQGQPLDGERLVERGPQLLGYGGGTLDGGDLGEQHGELVAAQARDGIDLAKRAAQALADLDEQLVAVMVSKRVVDLFEPVQIQQQQRGRDQRPVGVTDRLLDPVAQ